MIGMLKLSALVSVVAVEDLLLVANQTASSNFRYFEALTAAGIYYLVLTTVFMALQSLIERRLDPKSRRQRKATPVLSRLIGTGRASTVR
ncbi:MAG: putative amino-acid permease protein YxeN [Paracidovorax wautersii]|uniref:Putative amino-acid permease protein YxeN n=1 Tax=Paracidovorax wautersii TaxID=1177982 RepID=A0A7V8FS86_9BURK|nr:MAG: putative amino-acid permease protein YxeN [Paracidovorax wautersii]